MSDIASATETHCAHTWMDGADECMACGEPLTFVDEPPEPPCPDCGNDPTDETLHRDGCRRILPRNHPLERMQFGPPFEPWTRDHWRELEAARFMAATDRVAPVREAIASARNEES